jgi:hypothetical protein
MAFIGNRPDRATARATAVFFARAAASAFFRISTLRVLRPKSRSSVRIRSSSWRTTHGGADDLVVDPDRLAAACGHPLPPLKQQARRDAVRAGHERDRHARLQRLLDQPDRLRHPPPPANRDSSGRAHVPRFESCPHRRWTLSRRRRSARNSLCLEVLHVPSPAGEDIRWY